MAVLATQWHYSRTGNKKSKLSVGCWHNLEATVQLHRVRVGVHHRATFARHVWHRSILDLCAALSES